MRSDLAGAGPVRWAPSGSPRGGGRPLSVELEKPTHTMMDPEQRIWGFETNFGGLAELAIVKTNQLMPKPTPDVGRGRDAGR